MTHPEIHDPSCTVLVFPDLSDSVVRSGDFLERAVAAAAALGGRLEERPTLVDGWAAERERDDPAEIRWRGRRADIRFARALVVTGQGRDPGWAGSQASAREFVERLRMTADAPSPIDAVGLGHEAAEAADALLPDLFWLPDERAATRFEAELALLCPGASVAEVRLRNQATASVAEDR